jgi:alpha-methylacyl-CoA racemase
VPGPLQGVRVVELAGKGPGPHAAMLLADLGADVVRVERPGEHASVLTGGAPDHLLRGRRIVALDLKDPHDVVVLRDLLAQADVMLEGFRPGVLERLGLGPDVVLEHNSRLVYARITGWGREGDLAPRAGHDINYIALSGVLHAIGPAGQPPVPPLNLLGDFGGGSMLAVIGVLGALVERDRSGHGQVVDVAMVDGVCLLAQMIHAMRGAGTWNDTRGSNLLDGGAPFNTTYACADGGFIAVGALEGEFYAQLVDGLDLDLRELPAQLDPAGWPFLRERFAERFATRSRDEWAEQFAGTDACVTPVLQFEEALHDEHLASRGTFIDLDGVRQPAPAPQFSRTPSPLPAPPPSAPTDARGVLAGWQRHDQTPR